MIKNKALETSKGEERVQGRMSDGKRKCHGWTTRKNLSQPPKKHMYTQASYITQVLSLTLGYGF